jgi:hypothetical protein
MSDDPLDKTTSIGAELTPTGLSVNAKSRLIAAIDRFGGNLVDLVNVPMERRLSRDRAKIAGEQQLIQAIKKAAPERMSSDPEFAERAIRNHVGRTFDRQDNKDGVMRHALDDLRRDPAAEEATPELDPAFANKFERHAEDAATEQLREKWGRVLAAEIRKPGTVTPRVMRIVDEIDAETAQAFEELCEWRIEAAVPNVLFGELEWRKVSKLVGAGLLADPGFVGQIRVMAKHGQVWFCAFGDRGFVIPCDFEFATEPFDNRRNVPLRMEGDKPAIPVFVLTDEGLALAGILPDRQGLAFEALLEKLRAAHPRMPVKVLAAAGEDMWRPLFDIPLGS